MFPILKSKLRPPAVRWAVVERATLLLRLDAAAADPAVHLVLLTAAAGYSKTTVLADWGRRLHRRGVPVAWYSLGPGDRALPIFCAYLTAALREAVPGFGAIYNQVDGAWPADAPAGEQVDTAVGTVVMLTPLLVALERTLAAAAPGREPGAPQLVIVLDDAHHVAGVPDLAMALSFLIRHLPVGVVLALAARRALGRGLPLARLRQSHQLVSFDERDLRLLPPEVARAYPDLATLTAGSRALATLVRDLEGWPAGLALLHDHLVDAGPGADVTPLVRPARDALYAYLEEEVLAGVSEPLYSFLLRAAVLDQLTVPACNALTGLTGSEVLLTQALHHHLFLERTQIDPPAYVFQRLFCDFLLRRLEQMYGAGERRRLHRVAAAYYAAEKRWPDAAHHFLVAGDLDAVLLAVEAAREPDPGGGPPDLAALGMRLSDAGDPAVRLRLVETLGGRDPQGAPAGDQPLLEAFLADNHPLVQAAARQACMRLAQRAQGLLRIQTFGGLQVWRGDMAVPARAWRRRRARLLLVYLLLAGAEGAARGQIAEKVWPEARPAEAAAQFYAHLRTLRAVLEPDLAPGAPSQYIVSRAGRYAFNFGAPHQWDLADFQQHRDAGRRAERLGQSAAAVPAYTAALACYGGPLLPEPDLADVPWLLTRRAACHDDAVAMRARLAEYAAAAGEWEPAIAHWQALLRLAPAHEEAHARLMALYARVGRRAEALAQFHAARAALAAAYGTAPGPALTTLYAQLLGAVTSDQ
jgi:LuxR family maltose regulon positive regulatory protein